MVPEHEEQSEAPGVSGLAPCAPSPPLPGVHAGLGQSVLCVVFSVQLNIIPEGVVFVILACRPWVSGRLGEEVESALIYCLRPPLPHVLGLTGPRPLCTCSEEGGNLVTSVER